MAFRIPLFGRTAEVIVKDLPNRVQIHKSKHITAQSWCQKHLGPKWCITENKNGVWAFFWAGYDNRDYFDYYFSKDRDMILFSLRWSS